MSKPITETLEMLEEKIENIKWLITPPFSFKRAGISNTISIIRKSSGILKHRSLKGAAFENRIRKSWKTSLSARTA